MDKIKNKTQALRLIKELIGANIGLPEFTHMALNNWLITNVSRYNNFANCPFVVKKAYAKGRTFSALHFVTNSGTNVLITQSAINASTKAKKPASNKRQQVLSTMRELIESQIVEFRTAEKLRLSQLEAQGQIGANSCPLCGKRLIGRLHVDHWPTPFIKLADNWLEQNGFNAYSDVSWNSKLMKSWRDYHLANAKLRLTIASANIRQGASGYISKFKH